MNEVMIGNISEKSIITAKTVATDKNFERTIFVRLKGEEISKTSVLFFLSSKGDTVFCFHGGCRTGKKECQGH